MRTILRTFDFSVQRERRVEVVSEPIFCGNTMKIPPSFATVVGFVPRLYVGFHHAGRAAHARYFRFAFVWCIGHNSPLASMRVTGAIGGHGVVRL